MFELSKATEYAILLLTKLNSCQPVSLKEIAKKDKLPLKYLEKISTKLKKAKILTSKEGSGGGYYLANKPAKISLINIIETIEGKRGLVNCVHGRCDMQNNCHKSTVWKKLQFRLEKELGKIKLTDLME